MNPNQLPEPLDITQYLQTEGRRIAAELGSRRAEENAAVQQQQCAAPGTQKPPRSLSETLQRMGVTSAHKLRL